MKKFDLVELGQMSLGLDVEATEPDVWPGLTPEEQAARAEQARKVLEGGGHWEKAPDWFGDYAQLRELGFTWRVAVYVAWSATPKAERWPKNQEELATQVLGLSSSQAVSRWRRKDPRIDDAIVMMQSAPLFEHRAGFYKAMIQVGTEADYKGFNDRRMALEMLGDYVPRSQMEVKSKRLVNDLSEMSEEELTALAGRRKAEGGRRNAEGGMQNEE